VNKFDEEFNEYPADLAGFYGVRNPGWVVIGVGACFLAACGAGLPPEQESGSTQASRPQGCESTGSAIEFSVDNNAATVFWAADTRIDPADPAVQPRIKLLFDIPAGQLPLGVLSSRIRIRPEPNGRLPQGGHVDTAFAIQALDPADLTGFTGTGQVPLTLTIRYDPIACQVPEEIEADLVLGRLNASGAWQEVCGDSAVTGVGGREVSCAGGDLSFGVFGVIPRGGPILDSTPPVFPPQTVSLNSPSRCDTCPTPSIELEWGPASDGAGSGIKGYRIYVDGIFVVFTSDTTADPTVNFTLRSSGTLDTTQTHRYQVSALDNADNESALFGSLITP
jgi:hypothetical protein